MGLLDDAIREHLELKRRRGADPAEVARAEQEALGPVRRDREAAPSASEEQLDEVANGSARAPDDDHAEQTRALFPEDRETGPAQPESPADEAPLPPLPGSSPGMTSDDRAADAGRVSERDLADSHADEPAPRGLASDDDDAAGGRRDAGDGAPPASSSAAHPGARAEPDAADHAGDRDILDQPTTEYRIEDLEDEERRRGDAPSRGEDGEVLDLDETPDFLQETPEHDRLWFEQRPPRDFDFDD